MSDRSGVAGRDASSGSKTWDAARVGLFGGLCGGPREWYRRLGQHVVEETSEYLLSTLGIRSDHFSEARLRGLIRDCTIRPLADIAYVVTF